jgi:anti-sigma-K factor RskA
MLHFDPDEFDDETFLAFQRIETNAAMLTDEDFQLYDPPDHVWEGIVARIAADRSGISGSDSSARLTVLDEPPAVVSLAQARDRRSRSTGASRWVMPFAAAAAVMLLVGVVWATASDTGSGGVELASAPLGELSQSGARADATLIREDDGLHVQLANANMPPAPAGFYYEIWLVDPEVTDPRSLSAGSMGGRVDFTVPEGVDPAKYPIIDVSLEPDDGNPAHSGTQNSVARGVLEL